MNNHNEMKLINKQKLTIMKLKFILLLFCISFGYSQMNAQSIETIKLPPPQKKGGMSLMKALNNRQSQRSYSNKDLSLKQMSNLLWAAYGINRPNGYRTAPSARTSLKITFLKFFYFNIPKPNFIPMIL